MSRPKDQGTSFETARKRGWHDVDVPGGRLAEGGLSDLGDLWLHAHPEGASPEDGWIEEDKFRQRLNLHKSLAKALSKAGHRRLLFAWKRLTKDDGNSRRTPDGMPTVVAAHPQTAAVLLRAYLELQGRDPEFVDRLWSDG